MRVTLSIPDDVARRFQASVPARKRSKLVTELLMKELSKLEGALAAACINANADAKLNVEVEEWQAFEDEISE